MSLDKATVRNIATLARIKVPEEDLEPLAVELSGLLAWVEKLQAVDTTAVAPMTSVVAMRLPRRPDLVTDGNCREKVLANAPDSVEGFFVVPKVVE